MKDQLIVLMEALRLSRREIDKLRNRKQGVETTVAAIEHILSDPEVIAAIDNLEPFVPSPSIAPDVEERVQEYGHA